MQHPAPSPLPPSDADKETTHRRGFFTRASAAVIGAVVAAVPLLAGLVVLFDPLRRRSAGAGEKVRVAPLDALPADGMPRRFTVYVDQTDAWNFYPKQPLGAVYLRRTAGGEVEAFNNLCPHLGCPVAFNEERKEYFCPCHNSMFTIDGKVVEPSPSPRPLDSLNVEIKDTEGVKEVWVKFENFYTDTAEKIPRV